MSFFGNYFVAKNDTWTGKIDALQAIAFDFDVFPRKRKAWDKWKKEDLTSEEKDALRKAAREVLRKCWKEKFLADDAISKHYNTWKTEVLEKEKHTYREFIRILNEYYTTKTVMIDPQGKYRFIRNKTDPFRKKHSISESVKWGTYQKKEDLGAFNQKMVNLILEKKSDYNIDNDTIHIDHVLSCQVLHALLLQSDIKYSFDRFFAIKTWINKCWNFQPLPAAVNGRKGKVESWIIKWLQSNPLSKKTAPPQKVREYFQFVVQRMNNNCKSNWLAQTRYLKNWLSETLFFLADAAVVPQRSSYECEKPCFCLEDNKSFMERMSTFHLFCQTSKHNGYEKYLKVLASIKDRTRKAAEQKERAKNVGF
eukprot:CAMPEP_0201519316 /NCGR_PEP_ID=MMETSP0161_2-20130828/9899_1 /ASSEMBLY_ACC=CAM_ASM_000251 /TAXON_ID=180227 /ORGANISM="Neoparamoeba aestuarina, Strain SoJaBio B1-5/56/2" /LENGTH=365 /DNA_ID=CAMNT_0047917311 /DNA_START=210 /DNA_END=1307 /DNA_ORIENTATION=-